MMIYSRNSMQLGQNNIATKQMYCFSWGNFGATPVKQSGYNGHADN